MSTPVIIAIIVLMTLGFAVVISVLIWQFRRLQDVQKRASEMQKDPFSLINQNIQGIQQRMDESARSMQQAMQSQFGQSAKIIQDVTERLTKLDETNKQVLNFSGQLQNLQDLLKNPKQRGAVGEYYLETVLKNVLPPGSYQMQYPFKDGEIVDAVVKVKNLLIPIDSKFSLENYNRLAETHEELERERLEKAFVNDLKLRIQETAKYIRPAEGTMEFAFMFIPSEAIYYDLLINKVGAVKENTENLIQRAAGKYKVIIVSPTSFLAYLQTVLQGLRALQIEESAKEIRKNVEQLTRHLASYENHFTRVGNHLGTTVSAYNTARKEFSKIDKDVMRITGKDSGAEGVLLEKPEEGEG
ncbi:MAG: DNA recombination protein RmuC [bacterium]|nr:DNA recombination protein RmuC [bacterium]